MVAGSKRRRVDDVKLLAVENLALTLDGIESDRDACLIALLYLSGRRVGEVLDLKKNVFHVEEKRISFETFNEKVYRSTRTGNFQIVKDEIAISEGVNPGTKPRFYERIRPHWRTDIGSGILLTKFVTKRLDSLDENSYLFQRVRQGSEQAPIGRSQAYRIITFYFPDYWPHLLRHDRFTEIAQVYKDDPVSMHRYTFHKRFESTLEYIRNQEEEKI